MSMSTAALSDVFDAARALFTERRLPSSQMTEKDVQGIIEKLDKITVAQVGLAKQAEEVSERASERLRRFPTPTRLSAAPVLRADRPSRLFHAFRAALGAQEDLEPVAEPLQGSDQP